MIYKQTLLLMIFFFGFLYGQVEEPVAPLFRELLIEYSNTRDFTISADEDEAYFSIQSPQGDVSAIVLIKKSLRKWSKPKLLGFTGKYMDLEPAFSPDEHRLYFVSDRPMDPDENAAGDYNIWFVQRDNRRSEWSNPIPLDTTINTTHNEFYPSLTVTGNLYFTSDNPNSQGKDDIFFSEFRNGRFLEPVPLGESINSPGYEFNAYISPDESFLLFSGYNRPDGQGSGDLYISYQGENGVWGSARNLGPSINSKYMDYCPYVNVTTNTLYFTSKRNNIVQGKAGFESLKELSAEITKYDNGFSRIYQVSMDEILP